MGNIGTITTDAGCTVGIVERGLEDLRLGEVRTLDGDVLVRPGEARLEGDDLVRAGEVRLDGDDLGRPGEDVLVDIEESVLTVEAVLMAALLLPPTAMPTGIDVFVGALVVSSFLLRPLVKRRGLSIFYLFLFLCFYLYFIFT